MSPAGPLTWLDPGAFDTLGVGAGFALGAKLARPDAEVWVLFGDGAAGYSLVELDDDSDDPICGAPPDWNFVR